MLPARPTFCFQKYSTFDKSETSLKILNDEVRLLLAVSCCSVLLFSICDKTNQLEPDLLKLCL